MAQANPRSSWVRGSLIAKLLIPVNIITFVLLASMAVLMVFESKRSVNSTLRSKADGMLTFLESAGRPYLAHPDPTSLSSLESLARVVVSDHDFNTAIFFDADNKLLKEVSGQIDEGGVVRMERDILDPQGKRLGRAVLGYSDQRVMSAYREMMMLAGVFIVLVQLLLSLAVWAVARSIIRPLFESLSRLGRTTAVLSNTSTDISKFSEYLSSGVNQQAEVVQETTAAMSEMSTMLNQASTYARESEDVMIAVKQKANNGMNIMNQMVDAMGSVQQVNEQLKQMVDIIREIATRTNVINDIVFKTQLLSFNASIEAARAGQHGRGFAVVAEEVGNLAKTSGSAAQQIAILLQDSERQVTEIVHSTAERVSLGKSVSEQALRNFKEIAADINAMATHVSNITLAAREQELGVAQTTQAMGELGNATEINNGVAQRSSDTARTLEAEVQTLYSIAQAIEFSITGVLGLSMPAERNVPVTPPPYPVQAPVHSLAASNFHDNQNQGGVPRENATAQPTLSTQELGRKIVEMAHRTRDLDLVRSQVGRAPKADDPASKLGNVG